MDNGIAGASGSTGRAGRIARLEALLRQEVYQKGGFTMDRGGAPVQDGLAVCADPATILSFPDRRWSAEAVRTWLLAQDERLRTGEVYLGGWHDVASHTVYLELSYVFPRHLLGACMAVAVANRRRAIFDIGQQRVLEVPASMRALPSAAPATTAGPGLPAIDLERHRREYFTEGFTLLHDLFPPATLSRWREWGLKNAELGMSLDAVSDRSWVFQQPDQRHAYRMIDGTTLQERLPDLFDGYRALIPLLSRVTFQDVVVAPYAASGINLLVYDRPGSGIGWHYDTNLITVLLYLSDNEEGGTECRLLPTRPEQEEHRCRIIKPRAGTALLMQGRWVLHRGLPMADEVKVVSPWNYYSTTDQWRPAEFDDRIYGRR